MEAWMPCASPRTCALRCPRFIPDLQHPISLMKRFVVVGLGNFGRSVARTLYEQGHEVVAIDVNADAVDAAGRYATRAAVGDGRQRDLLDRLGADHADAAIVSTGDDVTASILTTLALRDLGVPRVYCKVVSDDHRRVMGRLGADEAVFPEQESGRSLALRLSSGDVFNYLPLGEGVSMQELRVPEPWQGQSIRALDLRARYRLVAVAVHNIVSDRLTVPPDPDAKLTGQDTLLLAGRDADLAQVHK